MMNGIYPGEARGILDAFCIYKGVGEIFDLSNLPIVRKRFSFGGESIIPLGYEITDKCIACGICMNKCPEKAVSSGVTYNIKRERCIECGLCFESCPVDAITAPGYI